MTKEEGLRLEPGQKLIWRPATGKAAGVNLPCKFIEHKQMTSSHTGNLIDRWRVKFKKNDCRLLLTIVDKMRYFKRPYQLTVKIDSLHFPTVKRTTGEFRAVEVDL